MTNTPTTEELIKCLDWLISNDTAIYEPSENGSIRRFGTDIATCIRDRLLAAQEMAEALKYMLSFAEEYAGFNEFIEERAALAKWEGK